MDFDIDRVRAFGQTLVEQFGASMLTSMLDVGDRTGLLHAAAEGPGTAAEIADRAGASERATREWLAAMATGGIIDHADGRFTLPPEHALLLTGDSHYNLVPLARAATATGGATERIARAVVDGRGIDHDEFDDELVSTIDAMSRRRFDAMLVDAYLPATGMTSRLAEPGSRVVDLGCGTGHAAMLMAEAFPAAEVVGIDASTRAIDRARRAAEERQLANLAFLEADAVAVVDAGPLDLVTAFDVIHDLPRPEAVLEAVRASLADDGRFLMYETAAPSDLDEQVALPWASLMYGLSLAHCLQVARAGGGVGLGTMWGREAATDALACAGFADVTVHEAPGDPMNLLYVART